MDLAARAGEAGLVELDPGGSVTAHAVLPGAEPEQHEVHVMEAGLADQRIDEAEGEFVLSWFDEVPIHGGDQGVEVHFDEAGPKRTQVFHIRGAGVAQFASA